MNSVSFSVGVAKRNMIKDYLSAAVIQFCFAIIFLFLFIQGGENAVRRHLDHDEACIHSRQVLDRRDQEQESREECNKLAPVQSAVLHLKYRECQNNRDSDHA